jgi:ABC-type glycerol-3-phosphate transport system substrate-binding protein
MDAQGIGITFNTGKIAIGGQSAATLMYRQINHNQPWEWGAVPMPAGPAGHAHWADGNALAISSACRNPDLAWDYVNLLTSNRAWDVTLEMGIPFRMPPRLSVINGTEFRKAWAFTDVDMLLEATSGSKGINPTVPSSPGSFRIVYEVLVNEIQNYVRGVRDLEATIATIEEQANDILEDYR